MKDAGRIRSDASMNLKSRGAYIVLVHEIVCSNRRFHESEESRCVHSASAGDRVFESALP